MQPGTVKGQWSRIRWRGCRMGEGTERPDASVSVGSFPPVAPRRLVLGRVAGDPLDEAHHQPDPDKDQDDGEQLRTRCRRAEVAVCSPSSPGRTLRRGRSHGEPLSRHPSTPTRRLHNVDYGTTVQPSTTRGQRFNHCSNHRVPHCGEVVDDRQQVGLGRRPGPIGGRILAGGLEPVDLVTESLVVGSSQDDLVPGEAATGPETARLVVALAVAAAAVLRRSARSGGNAELLPAPLAAGHPW